MTLTPLTVPSGYERPGRLPCSSLCLTAPASGAGARRERPCLAGSGGVPAGDGRRARDALIATDAAGVPLRDPSHVTEGRLTSALLLVAVLIARRRA